MENHPDHELRRGWPAIVATFAVAVFAWGFGSYGHAVYIEQLQRLHGWPTSALGAATTLCFLLGACLLPWVGWTIDRFGERWILLGGVALLGAGAIGVSQVTALWQVFPCEILMGIGWSGCGLTAISISLARRFERKRGFALGLALNGAGVSGFGVAPALMMLSERMTFDTATPIIVLSLVAVVAPLIWLGLGRRSSSEHAPRNLDAGIASDEAAPSRGELLTDLQFWSIAAPFALALSAQVGLFIYQVS